jgi:hypothetical protein
MKLRRNSFLVGWNVIRSEPRALCLFLSAEHKKPRWTTHNIHPSQSHCPCFRQSTPPLAKPVSDEIRHASAEYFEKFTPVKMLPITIPEICVTTWFTNFSALWFFPTYFALPAAVLLASDCHSGATSRRSNFHELSYPILSLPIHEELSSLSQLFTSAFLSRKIQSQNFEANLDVRDLSDTEQDDRWKSLK